MGTQVGDDGALAAQKRRDDINLRGSRASGRRDASHEPSSDCSVPLPHHTHTHVPNMPHSVSPESTPAGGSSREMSQADDIKPEPETQDATMEDAPSPPAPAPAPTEKSKVNLEELFDDDSDGEFASSAPVKSEEEASQPAPLYVTVLVPATTLTHTWQQNHKSILLLRPRNYARFLPAPVSLPLPLPVAEP